MEYISGPHLEKQPLKTIEQWEQLIFHKHAFSTTQTPRESYLDLLKKRDYYGAIFFAVKQKFERAFPKRILMAISRKGIILLRIPTTFTDSDLDILGVYNLADIYRWAYKPGVNFYFEIKDDRLDTNPVYTFDTPEGKHMSDMLTDYAMALLREMGLNPDGTKRIRPKDRAAALANTTSSSSGAPADILPTKSAMATTTEAYKEVGGQVGSLASAAIRSGEYVDTPAVPSTTTTNVGGVPPPPPPPPPPMNGLPPPPPPPPPSSSENSNTVSSVTSTAEETSEPTDTPVSPGKVFLGSPAKVPIDGTTTETPSVTSTTETAPSESTSSTVDEVLPANWIKVFDDSSQTHYYFNTVSGDSVWDRAEIPAE